MYVLLRLYLVLLLAATATSLTQEQVFDVRRWLGHPFRHALQQKLVSNVRGGEKGDLGEGWRKKRRKRGREEREGRRNKGRGEKGREGEREREAEKEERRKNGHGGTCGRG